MQRAILILAAGFLSAIMAMAPILATATEKQWEWKFPVRQVAWDNVQRIGSDRSYPVFVQGELVLVSCEYNGALLALDDLDAQSLSPGGQLLDGGCAEGVARDQQQAFALGGEFGGELSDGGGLAGAVDADHEHNGGLAVIPNAPTAWQLQ